MEIFKEVLIAIGGGATALIALLVILRTMFLKIYEKAIDTTFDKTIEKYRNKLNRSTTAYELLLHKEFEFYSNLDPHIAQLVPLVQDLVYYAGGDDASERRAEEFRECLITYTKMIPEMKNLDVLYQPYIPHSVFTSVAALISTMQNSLEFWTTVANILWGRDDSEIDIDRAKDISDSVLMCISEVEYDIKIRLGELSEA